jgi:hypothetical protein
MSSMLKDRFNRSRRSRQIQAYLAEQVQTSAVVVLPVADRLSAAAGHPSAVGCSPVAAGHPSAVGCSPVVASGFA